MIEETEIHGKRNGEQKLQKFSRKVEDYADSTNLHSNNSKNKVRRD